MPENDGHQPSSAQWAAADDDLDGRAHYRVLGIPVSATQEEIRAAYRCTARWEEAGEQAIIKSAGRQRNRGRLCSPGAHIGDMCAITMQLPGLHPARAAVLQHCQVIQVQTCYSPSAKPLWGGGGRAGHSAVCSTEPLHRAHARYLLLVHQVLEKRVVHGVLEVHY